MEGKEAPWLDFRIAVRHLDAIDDLLDQMAGAGRNVSVFRRYFNMWEQIVFAYPRGWQVPGSGATDSTSLDHLENLADRLQDFVPTVKPDGLDQIRDYATKVDEALTEDDSIDPLLKLHARQVVAHLQWCIENYDKVGDFDLQEAIERLASSVLRAAANSTNESRWRTVMDGWVWPFVVNVAAAIPGSALAQYALGSA